MTTSRIEIVQGDIAVQEVDAIVNAANESLLGGGEVDGAIHRAAGPGLLAECKMLGGCPTGEARITAGHQLPSRFVIHAVGPIWQGGGAGEAELLASCHHAAMRLAVEKRCRSVAFPAIGCGAYGYPWREAVKVSLATVRSFIEANDTVQLVRWVLYGGEIFDTWQKEATRAGLRYFEVMSLQGCGITRGKPDVFRPVKLDRAIRRFKNEVLLGDSAK